MCLHVRCLLLPFPVHAAINTCDPRKLNMRVQVADITLVKHLLQHSRTLEINHKDPSGLTFLECLTKHLANMPLLPFASCMDELLSRR